VATLLLGGTPPARPISTPRPVPEPPIPQATPDPSLAERGGDETLGYERFQDHEPLGYRIWLEGEELVVFVSDETVTVLLMEFMLASRTAAQARLDEDDAAFQAGRESGSVVRGSISVGLGTVGLAVGSCAAAPFTAFLTAIPCVVSIGAVALGVWELVDAARGQGHERDTARDAHTAYVDALSQAREVFAILRSYSSP
jgi:hypothetical protein